MQRLLHCWNPQHSMGCGKSHLQLSTICIGGLAASSIPLLNIRSQTTVQPSGRSTKMSQDSKFPLEIRKYTPRHSTWPYSTSDMTPQDTSNDSMFYSAPRFVTHIDDDAIVDLRRYYAEVLPRTGRILDLCSSWISHFPSELEPTKEDASGGRELLVYGVGMSSPEMERNATLTGGRFVKDLNIDPSISAKDDLGLDESDLLDATVCVVSIDYLRQPVEVLSSIRKGTKNGGRVHLVISNRCFPTKAVNRWLRVDEEERLQMVGDYLHFSGWREIEILTLSDGLEETKVDADSSASGGRSTVQRLMSMMGMHGRDPLWVVRGVNSIRIL